MSSLTVVRLAGSEITPYIMELASLRIKIFRTFPYLYEGSEEYEKNYLKTYTDCPDSVLVLVKSAQQIVGASSALPLKYEVDECKNPFIKNGYDINNIFYFGESVLLPEFRGQGIGHRFFDEREAAAREQGYTITSFCAVERPLDHPLKPADYQPLDRFWEKRGYQKQPKLNTFFSWQDINETQASLKPMVFWTKLL